MAQSVAGGTKLKARATDSRQFVAGVSGEVGDEPDDGVQEMEKPVQKL